MTTHQPLLPGLRARVAPMGKAPTPAVPPTPWELLQPALSKFLPEAWLRDRPGTRRRVFTLSVTFWSFLLQVLRPATSCREALRQVQSALATQGRSISASTGGFCQARLRLPVLLLRRLLHRLGAGGERTWFGLRPVLVDCTHVRMAADTPENRRYRQPAGIRPGCGFPVLKVAALFSLATGRILTFATGELYRHDLPLSKRLWRWLKPGDVVVGDRAFCDYVSIAILLARGVHTLFRAHQGLKLDLRRAERLGASDGLLTLKKPKRRPPSLTPEQWAALPDVLFVRVVKYRVCGSPARTGNVTLLTTLTDAKAIPTDALAELYNRRWNLELCFRNLKTTMGMEELRGRTPGMVYRELILFLIAHNLTRHLMAEASQQTPGTDLHRLSFAGAQAALRQFTPRLLAARGKAKRRELRDELLRVIALDKVPERKGRREPRAVKRRKKPYPMLTKPRAEFREVPHPSRYRKNKGKSGAAA